MAYTHCLLTSLSLCVLFIAGISRDCKASIGFPNSRTQPLLQSVELTHHMNWDAGEGERERERERAICDI